MTTSLDRPAWQPLREARIDPSALLTMLNLLQVLEAGLAIEQGGTQAGGPQPGLVGTVSAKGTVAFFGGEAMPGAFRIESDFGKFRAGDTVVFVQGGWSEGRFVIVEHGSGDWRVHRCETRHGLQFLVAGDAILFDPDNHTIIGIAVERREPL